MTYSINLDEMTLNEIYEFCLIEYFAIHFVIM